MDKQQKRRRYINPLTDFGFKKVFGDEEIMRDFLNDIIEPKSPIVSLTFIDKELKPATKFDHGVVYDMRCHLASGEEVIVEMQNRSQDYFRDRICFYMSHAIAAQGERSDEEEWAFQIHPVYGVFFMNFRLKEDIDEDDAAGDGQKDRQKKKRQPVEPHDIRHIALADIDTHDVFSKKMQMWLIELPRYRRKKEVDCNDNRDYWLYNLTHLGTMRTSVPFQDRKPIFHKLESIADMAQLTHEEREHYDISLISFRTNLACLKHERNEGRKEGIVKGMAKGRAEGREEGLAKGREEGRMRQLSTAASLKAMGIIPVSKIAEATGLTEDEIEKL